MTSITFEHDENVILESEDVSWISRDGENIDRFVLTNKRLYCAYKKSNGLFKKATNELSVFLLTDIRIINGQVQVQQTKYEGEYCLHIQFVQGHEYFLFSDSPKKTNLQWVAAINKVLGFSEPEQTSKSSKRTGLFAGLFAGVANRSVDAQAQTSTTVTSDSQAQDECDSTVPCFCSNCGAKLSPEAKFCQLCGSKIATTTSQLHSTAISDDALNDSAPTFAMKVGEQVESEQVPPDSLVRQQEYVGKVYKCPNCGNVVNLSDIICSACGCRLSGKKAISSVKDFQEQLLRIEMTRQNRDKELKNQDEEFDPELIDDTDKQIIAFIKLYPIPNTIEDIVEFMHLAVGNINIRKSKKSIFNTTGWEGESRERMVSNAWVGKLQQIYRKAELYFPDEPEFAHIKEVYESIMAQLKLK
ncbi:MAG: zinc-ribbon domain-containing protein [Lachnospiraceae bacterium]|nr:zinc-ribbon domain-containing protein [Lachnospiraceae bacterium]